MRAARTFPVPAGARRVMVRGAFTVIEVLLALALSSLVLGAAIGLYQVLGASDRASEQQFERAADLAVTQITVRKIMNTLVAGTAEPAPAQPAVAQNDEEEVEAEPEEEGEGGGGQESAPILAQAPAHAPVMFDLWWEEHDGIDGGTVILPTLEVVVSEPPVALRGASERIDEEDLRRVDESLAEEALRRTDRLSESVRGLIEMVGAPDGWRLRWRPIEPAARPFVLASRIASAEDGGPYISWRVLSRDDKVDAWEFFWSATIREEFPLAVQLSFMTTGGETVDWMFETHVTTQE